MLQFSSCTPVKQEVKMWGKTIHSEETVIPKVKRKLQYKYNIAVISCMENATEWISGKII